MSTDKEQEKQREYYDKPHKLSDYYLEQMF